MAETEIPNGTHGSTVPSVEAPNGHGPGYDGLRTTDGHEPSPGQKPVTMVIVGAGQRGSVSDCFTQTPPQLSPTSLGEETILEKEAYWRRSTLVMHLSILNQRRW